MPNTEYRITTVKGGRRHGQTLWMNKAKPFHKISYMGYNEVYKIIDGIAVYQHQERGYVSTSIFKRKKNKGGGVTF